ncbi:MAG: DUF559 domain-containing protein [Capsulimonadaceae bacterium]|nr:DUF559 domain-containing protein [Capsulimonadaceae bacterium]
MPATIIKQSDSKNDIGESLPPAELLLWSELGTILLPGLQFTRDAIVGDHIVGLCCRSARVAVEFDLPMRSRRTAQDIARLQALEDRGFTIVPVETADVYNDLGSVCKKILATAVNNQSNGTLTARRRPGLYKGSVSISPAISSEDAYAADSARMSAQGFELQ